MAGRGRDRDLLYFLAEAFRARLVKELPASKEHASPALRQFAHRAKALLVELAEISLECAQSIKGLFTEFEAAGDVFQMRLKRQPWGAQNFVVRDLDGNLILFAG